MKEISFPTFEADIFATFDHVELMMFLIDCGEYLISVFFGSVRLSQIIIWSKSIPLTSWLISARER